MAVEAVARGELGVPVFLQLDIVVGRETVDARDLVAVVEQPRARWKPMKPAVPVTRMRIEA